MRKKYTLKSYLWFIESIRVFNKFIGIDINKHEDWILNFENNLFKKNQYVKELKSILENILAIEDISIHFMKARYILLYKN